MNPAFISGIRQDLPKPAGVRAPVRLIPTKPFCGSIFSVSSFAASRMRPPLYARNTSSTKSAADMSFPTPSGFNRGYPANLSLFAMAGLFANFPETQEALRQRASVQRDPELFDICSVKNDGLFWTCPHDDAFNCRSDWAQT